MSKVPAALSLLVLTTLAFAPGCTSTSCVPIPDGRYVAINADAAAGICKPGASGVDGGDGSAGGASGVDGGDASAGGAVTCTFQGGLPEPYNTWACDKPTPTCEMTYICTNGAARVAIVTSYSPGMLSFSVTTEEGSPEMTPPGTIVQLSAP